MSSEKDKVKTEEKKLTSNDVEWTDHVLSFLSDDEKIAGNPTTDGLRRIFEIVMNCTVTRSTSEIVQAPSPENEKRATVKHTLGYILNDPKTGKPNLKPEAFTQIGFLVDGSADVYWGNCDKTYRNYPIAVAETRAEGRALRRALKLRKVVAAEEVVANTEDDVHGDNVGKISANQISFIDVMSKRLNVDVLALLKSMSLNVKHVSSLTHDDAVGIIRQLSNYQQNVDNIPSDLKPYQDNWK